LSNSYYYLLKENQAREKNKIEKKKKDKNDERLKNKELLKEGKAPVFLNKSERKKKELVEQFEELKSSGRIDNYLKKKSQKEYDKGQEENVFREKLKMLPKQGNYFNNYSHRNIIKLYNIGKT